MKNILSFIILPVLFGVSGEFILKINVDNINLGLTMDSLLFLIASPSILFGVGLILVSACLWIVGMSKFQLSFMYPFLSINYVAVVVGSEVILNENVQLNRYFSVLLIIIGLLFISKSPNSIIKEQT